MPLRCRTAVIISFFSFTQKTFEYTSSHWKNKQPYEVNNGLKGLTKSETKLESFGKTSFTQICLGMSYNGAKKWMKFFYTANSLHDVIANGNFRQTSLSRVKWKSLISNAKLQSGCLDQGFNIKCNGFKARLGIIGNGESNCNSCDSWLGFGLWSDKKCGKTSTMTCGNGLMCPASSRKEFTAFGYVFVK